jgi:hypothetical protein
MYSKFKIFIAAAMLGLLSSLQTADAQEQTIENAMEFFKLALVGQGIDRPLQPQDIDSNGNVHRTLRFESIKRVMNDSTNRCLLKINTEESGDTIFDFSNADIKQIAQVAPEFIEVQRKGQFQRVFKISPEAMAKRVIYAMEFLRVKCDETSKTGF